MQMRQPNLDTTVTSRINQPHVLRALLAYEDISVALQGQEVLRCLATELEPAFELRSALWKFDLLQDPEVTGLATAEALEADVIIIAAHGNTDLPSASPAGWKAGWPKRTEALAH